MIKHEGLKQYLIELTSSNPALDMTEAKKLLRGFGFRLDNKYGPIPINPPEGKYIVRGKISEAGYRKFLETTSQKT